MFTLWPSVHWLQCGKRNEAWCTSMNPTASSTLMTGTRLQLQFVDEAITAMIRCHHCRQAELDCHSSLHIRLFPQCFLPNPLSYMQTRDTRRRRTVASKLQVYGSPKVAKEHMVEKSIIPFFQIDRSLPRLDPLTLQSQCALIGPAVGCHSYVFRLHLAGWIASLHRSLSTDTA